MEGWIKIYRKMLENPIICKDSDYLAVWIYLLLNATHQEIPALFKGEKIKLQPGQLITGRKAIANKLKISESKVYRILKCYKIEHQIEQQTSSSKSLITILKWDEYQKVNNEMNNKRTTSEHKQECNNIYIYLFNIYKGKIQSTTSWREKIKIISELKEHPDYLKLSLEEQQDLFNDLMQGGTNQW